MTWIFLLIDGLYLLAATGMLLCFREVWSRMLALGLVTTLTAAAFVLFALHTGQSMYLDLALVCVLLGFMDIQFFAVFYRERGALK